MFQSLLNADIQLLYMLGVAFMPSVVGLLLALFAHWLPDDRYVLSQQGGDRQYKHRHASDRGRDWRRAA